MNEVNNGRFSRRLLLGTAAGATLAATAGCSSSKSSAPTANKEVTSWPAHVEPKPIPGGYVSSVPGVSPAYTRLPDTIEQSVSEPPGKGGKMTVTSLQIVWAPPAAPYDNNPFWQELNKRLGVNYRPVVVPSNAFNAKFATAMAGGDIPDFVFVPRNAAGNRAIKDGAFADLADVLDGDKIKEYPNLAHYATWIWKASAIFGGIYGTPQQVSMVVPQFKYRADWGEKVGFSSAPKTPDELLKLGNEISTKGAVEPGKTKYLFGAWTSNNVHYVYTMFRCPNGWRLEKDGTLTNIIESDEYEAAMEYMAKMWKQGCMHPDGFAMVSQSAKVRNMFAAGDIGFTDGSFAFWAGPQGFTARTLKAQPQAKLDYLVPPGANGQPPGFPRNPGFGRRIAISAKTAKDKDKLRTILAMFNYFHAPFGSKENLFLTYGPEGKGYKIKNHLPVNIADTQMQTNINGTNYTGNQVPHLFDPANPQSAVKATKNYQEPMTKDAIPDPVANYVSPTQDKLAASLEQLGSTYFNDIVSGKKPISDLKKYRDAWKKAGGDKIRQEYEDAIQEDKKS